MKASDLSMEGHGVKCGALAVIFRLCRLDAWDWILSKEPPFLRDF